MELAAGETPFIDDMRLPDLAYGAPVMSEHPRAKILGIDTTAAGGNATLLSLGEDT